MLNQKSDIIPVNQGYDKLDRECWFQEYNNGIQVFKDFASWYPEEQNGFLNGIKASINECTDKEERKLIRQKLMEILHDTE